MTISGSGFGELGGEGFPVIRKPNEGEFSLVLPSGIPMPFKEAVEVTLSVSDAASDNVCDVVSIEVEGVLAVSDTLQENVSDALTLDIEAVLTVSEGAQAQYADDVTIEE